MPQLKCRHHSCWINHRGWHFPETCNYERPEYAEKIHNLSAFLNEKPEDVDLADWLYDHEAQTLLLAEQIFTELQDLFPGITKEKFRNGPIDDLILSTKDGQVGFNFFRAVALCTPYPYMNRAQTLRYALALTATDSDDDRYRLTFGGFGTNGGRGGPHYGYPTQKPSLDK